MPTTLSQSLPGFMRQAIRFLLPVDGTTCGSPLTDDPIPLFCASCWGPILSLAHSSCARCDRPVASPVETAQGPNHVCQSCAERPLSYARTCTLYPYLLFHLSKTPSAYSNTEERLRWLHHLPIS